MYWTEADGRFHRDTFRVVLLFVWHLGVQCPRARIGDADRWPPCCGSCYEPRTMAAAAASSACGSTSGCVPPPPAYLLLFKDEEEDEAEQADLREDYDDDAEARCDAWPWDPDPLAAGLRVLSVRGGAGAAPSLGVMRGRSLQPLLTRLRRVEDSASHNDKCR